MSAVVTQLAGIGRRVQKALQQEVMALNEKIEERVACGNPPEIEAKLKASRGRARALREELLRQEANGARHPE